MDAVLNPRDEYAIAREARREQQRAAARVKVKRALRVELRKAGIEGVTVR